MVQMKHNITVVLATGLPVFISHMVQMKQEYL